MCDAAACRKEKQCGNGIWYGSASRSVCMAYQTCRSSNNASISAASITMTYPRKWRGGVTLIGSIQPSTIMQRTAVAIPY